MTETTIATSKPSLVDHALQTVMDGSPLGMLVFGEDETVLYANPRAETLFGTTLREPARVRCGDFIGCANRHRDRRGCGHTPSCPHCPLYGTMRSVLASGEGDREGEAFLSRERGNESVWLRFKCSSIRLKGGKGALMALDDITARRQAEEREAHIKQVLLAIRNVNQLIVDETDRGRLIQGACANLTETLGYHNAWIALTDETDRPTTMTAASGFEEGFGVMQDRLEQGAFFPCMRRALEQGPLVVVRDPPAECPGCPLAGGYSGRAGLARPLSFEGRVYGFLCVSVPGAYAYDEEEQGLFNELANDLSFALSRLESRDHIRHLTGIIETIPQPMAVLSRDYRYLDVNAAYSDYFNAERQEILGRTPAEFLGHCVFEADIKPRLDRCLAGEPVRYEVRADFPGKGPVWMEMQYYPYRDPTGRVTGVISHGLDITERRRNQEALKRSETLLKEAQRVARIGYWELDTSVGTPVWSEEIFRIFGLDPEKGEPSFTDHETHVHSEDWPALNEAVRRAGEDGTPFDLVFRIVRPDGQVRWMHAIGTTSRDGRGKVTRLFGTAQDVTETKKAEEALRKSEAKYRALVDTAPYGIQLTDLEGRIVFSNPAHHRIQGFPEGELTGKFIWDLVAEEQEKLRTKEYYERLVKGSLASGVYFNTDRTKDGRLIETRIDWDYIRNNQGDVEGIISIISDITHQKELESQLRQAQKMESIGTLAGGIAHDFNNILSPILVHSEMAMMELPKDSPVQSSLGNIYKAGERARDLVKQILAFARKKEEDRIPLKLSLIVKEAIRFLRSTIPSTISIRYDLKAVRDTVFADPTQMNQVVMNLCTNAAHAMREQGGLLEVTLSDECVGEETTNPLIGLPSGHYLRVSVRDTGPGIPPQIMDRIFEPYFTTKGPGEGTGMGLAVVHGIVKSHGGDITVESAPGKGAVFHVLLPIIDAQVPLTPEPTTELSRGRERVLVVDDEKPAVQTLQAMLERLGYEVTARADGLEALEAFRNRPDAFDLVITDQTMPHITGRDLAKMLMTLRPDIPVILCTGFSEQIDQAGAEEMGIAAFVMKPITMGQIARTIRDVLDGVSQERRDAGP